MAQVLHLHVMFLHDALHVQSCDSVVCSFTPPSSVMLLGYFNSQLPVGYRKQVVVVVSLADDGVVLDAGYSPDDIHKVQCARSKPDVVFITYSFLVFLLCAIFLVVVLCSERINPIHSHPVLVNLLHYTRLWLIYYSYSSQFIEINSFVYIGQK